jgi:phosphoribosylanthranilate isomerase
LSKVSVKICGLSTPATLEAAIRAGVDMAGFVFYPTSPRHLSLAAARELQSHVAGRTKKVALTVDAGDDALEEIISALAPDILQLHGSETPGRVAAVKARFGLPVIKAVGVATEDDVKAATAYAAADMLLLDAKPAEGAVLPGGNGRAFDWRLLQKVAPGKPWLLAGGLAPENVAQALQLTRAPGVDASSGVESAKGIKDPARIAAFVAAARGAEI